MIKILEPRPAQSLEFWSEIEPHIAQALRYDIYNTVTLDDLKKQVGQGFARVLLAHDGERIMAASIAQLFRNSLEERILHVIATGGSESHLWLVPLRDFLAEIAAKENCAAVTMAGRPGWAKKLVKLGFRTDMVSMRLEVNQDERQQKPTGSSEREPASEPLVEPARRVSGSTSIH